MCNEQITNDRGLYDAQFNPNFNSALQAPAAQVLPAGGPVYINSQTLPLPTFNYNGSVSPQLVPIGMPSISPPPLMVPLLDGSPSPLPAMTLAMPSGFVPTIPLMGYSMIPFAQGAPLPMVPIPQASASPENQTAFLLPESCLTPPFQSVSRSCSPASDNSYNPEVDFSSQSYEVNRERLPSASSSSSLDSNTSIGQISKKQLVEECLRKVDQIFGNRVQTAGMRGQTVMRIKVKTRPALENIVGLLETLESKCNIVAISCPKSTKKGKQHIRGFLAYIQASTVSDIPLVQQVFNEFNEARRNGEDAPFRSLEVNPQKKQL